MRAAPQPLPTDLAWQDPAPPEPEEPETPQPKFVLGHGGGSLALLLPSGLSVVPPAVQHVSDEALRCDDQYQEAGAQLRAAEAEIKRAESVDRSADREAVATGRPLPVERAADKARIGLSEAERRHEAALQGSRDARWSPLPEPWLRSALSGSECKPPRSRTSASHCASSSATSSPPSNGSRLSSGCSTHSIEFPRQGSLVGTQFGRPSAREVASAEAQQQQAYDPALKSAKMGGSGSRQTDSHDVNGLEAALKLLIDSPARTPQRRAAW